MSVSKPTEEGIPAGKNLGDSCRKPNRFVQIETDVQEVHGEGYKVVYHVDGVLCMDLKTAQARVQRLIKKLDRDWKKWLKKETM